MLDPEIGDKGDEGGDEEEKGNGGGSTGDVDEAGGKREEECPEPEGAGDMIFRISPSLNG